jgi:RNA polymerase sigma factor (sigma-70 family)
VSIQPGTPIPNRTATPSDPTALVAGSLRGDPAAWRALVVQFDGLVRATIRSYRIHGADADDTAQNVWLRVVEKLDRVNQPERIAAWLVTTTRRECLATLRRRQRELPVEEIRDVILDPAGSPEEDALAGDVRRALGGALAGLTERRRAVLAALFLEPIDGYAAVSRSTGVPIGSIGPTRARALAELRTGMSERGYLTA